MPARVSKHRSAKGSKHPRGLTLERFAAAKSSGYSKRDKKEKQFALDAKQVNKYRKLKQKLQQQGMLPRDVQAQQQEEAKLRRIQERAGSPLADDNDQNSDFDQADPELSEADALDQHQQPTRHENTTRQDTNSLQPLSYNQGSYRSKQTGHAHQQPGDEDPQGLSKKGKRPKRQKPESHLQKLAKQVQTDKDAALQERQLAQKEAAERRARVAEVERQRKQQTSLLRRKTRTGQPVMKHRIDKILDALQQ